MTVVNNSAPRTHPITTNYAISQNLGCHVTIPEQGLAGAGVWVPWIPEPSTVNNK
jgi:hypothetical protein